MTVADKFLLMGIQEWGQSDEKRVQAVQDLLDAANFNARATCWPVFGAIWPKPCEGPDAEAATVWLKTLTRTMERGRFEDEVAHVERALVERTG